MESKRSLKSMVIEVICYLYVVLFAYAAVSKLLDFENFQVQLGQSPLLSAFAVWVAWLVPLIELIIAIALIIPKFKSIGLLAALSLMTMFTAYIFLMLHFSSFVPCSCGGILEKMSWNVHLAFNIVFVILAAVAIVLDYKKTGRAIFFPVRSIPITLIASTAVVIFLFLSSEDIMQHENPFIRRYPQHPVTFKKSIDLKFNSYYFAGSANDKVYLGNFTDPLHLIEVDTILQQRKQVKINLNGYNKHYKMVKIAIKADWFYIMDGSAPFILSGSIKDWKITKEFKDCPYFFHSTALRQDNHSL